MKTTGIVRRVDELGRIVIPKEIRRIFRIKEGTPIEIIAGDDGNIQLKKFSSVKQISDFSDECASAIYDIVKCNVFICDKETIITYYGMGKKNYLDKLISDKLFQIIEAKNIVKLNKENSISFVDGEDCKGSQVIAPICYGGDSYGAIVLFDIENELSFFAETDKMLLTLSNFIAKQMI